MSIQTIIMIAVIVGALAAAAALVYLYIRNWTLEEIRLDVYKLFLQAEHTYLETGAGKQKMKWVISRARSLLPSWLRVILTDDLLEKFVQKWFDAVKDLLDDGKYNQSIQEKEGTDD